MTRHELEAILLNYFDEESDGEFLRYYTLNPICLRPLLDDILAAVSPEERGETT